MAKINKNLLPIKAHYFFFMSAMGPILPILPVFGRMLGISEIAIGMVNAVLPIINIIIKPTFGFLLDYFNKKRKIIFILVLCFTSVTFLSMIFIPQGMHFKNEMECHELTSCENGQIKEMEKLGIKSQYCSWECPKNKMRLHTFTINNSTCVVNKEIYCRQNETCRLICRDEISGTYMGSTFWFYVICVALGNAGYAVSNCLSDVICFDILGPNGDNLYGKQRVYGSIGFGLVAFGAAVLHYFYTNEKYSSYDYMPAFLLATCCMVIDLFCCIKLKLPGIPTSSGIIRDALQLLRKPQIGVFVLFTTFVGMCDSVIIFFLLWHLEEMAETTGYAGSIVLLEGIVVAVETLCGEVVSFIFAGKIIKKVGHSNCITLGFGIYVLRFFLLAIIPTPWWAVPVEMFLQGPTYALLYNTIVAYASIVAPPGTSATVQGLVGGMDDGMGFAIGNILGGIILHQFGGRALFYSASGFALVCCISHAILNKIVQKYIATEKRPSELINSPVKVNIQSKEDRNEDRNNLLPKKASREDFTLAGDLENVEDSLLQKDNGGSGDVIR